MIFEELDTKVEKEYKFHPIRRWKFDYYLPEFGIAIEQEGGIFRGSRGRHTNPLGFIKDMEKYNTAGSMGIIVLRFSVQQLEKEYEKCLEMINETIKWKKTTFKH